MMSGPLRSASPWNVESNVAECCFTHLMLPSTIRRREKGWRPGKEWWLQRDSLLGPSHLPAIPYCLEELGWVCELR